VSIGFPGTDHHVPHPGLPVRGWRLAAKLVAGQRMADQPPDWICVVERAVGLERDRKGRKRAPGVERQRRFESDRLSASSPALREGA